MITSIQKYDTWLLFHAPTSAAVLLNVGYVVSNCFIHNTMWCSLVYIQTTPNTRLRCLDHCQLISIKYLFKFSMEFIQWLYSVLNQALNASELNYVGKYTMIVLSFTHCCHMHMICKSHIGCTIYFAVSVTRGIAGRCSYIWEHLECLQARYGGYHNIPHSFHNTVQSSNVIKGPNIAQHNIHLNSRKTLIAP